MTKERAAVSQRVVAGPKRFITLDGPQARNNSGRDDKFVCAEALSSRPERSVVERSAVSSPGLQPPFTTRQASSFNAVGGA